jgi:hypothetical protein
MAAIVDARIKMIIENYEKRIEILEEDMQLCAERSAGFEAEIRRLRDLLERQQASFRFADPTC